ncbi:MAG: glycosyl hydrolase family 65 protein [Bacteroidota bacterium]
MQSHFPLHPWHISESELFPEHYIFSESIFSLANGQIGIRGGFEETFQQKNHTDCFYQDIEEVCPNWHGLRLKLDGEELDLSRCKVRQFSRSIDMRQGILKRAFTIQLQNKQELTVSFSRFCSMDRPNLAVIIAEVRALLLPVEVEVVAEINGREKGNWQESMQYQHADDAYLVVKNATHKQLCTAFRTAFYQENQRIETTSTPISQDRYSALSTRISLGKTEGLRIVKYVSVESEGRDSAKQLIGNARERLQEAENMGVDALRTAHVQCWRNLWARTDIEIEGAPALQQGLRFSVFQFLQHSGGGHQAKAMSVGGLSGNRHLGQIGWNRELFALPFLSLSFPRGMASNILSERYTDLVKAIEHAKDRNFGLGAAQYPLFSQNGTEVAEDIQLASTSVFVNGLLAKCIQKYVEQSDDRLWLADKGAEILIRLARFWQQRCSYSPSRQQYVLLGVSGPNQYDSHGNNNFLTNQLAAWSLRYAQQTVEFIKEYHPVKYAGLIGKLDFEHSAETRAWERIADNLYIPTNDDVGIYLQEDGFFDKEQKMTEELASTQRPLWKNWPWDQIQSSCFVQQADVLLYFYLFGQNDDQLEKNYRFYASRCVHESAASPAVHAILAARLGWEEEAIRLSHLAARFDLDNVNLKTEQGLHIDGMPGVWLALIEGVAGLRFKDGVLQLRPRLPKAWPKMAFALQIGAHPLRVSLSQQLVEIENLHQDSFTMMVEEELVEIHGQQGIRMKHSPTSLNVLEWKEV